MSKKLNICFACNEDYFDLLLVSIHSAQKHNKNLHFFIYFNSSNEKLFDSISKIIFESENKVEFFDVNVIKKKLPSYLKQHIHITIETYFRLFLPELISEQRVLYLDVDLMVKGSLKQIYFADFDKYSFAAVPYLSDLNWIEERNISIGLDSDHPYFNAGVLLLDLNRLRINKIFENALKLISDNNDLNDQDALNIVVKKNYLRLDNRMNWTLHDKGRINNPLIVHFTGPFKPNIRFYDHPFARQYRILYKEVFNDYNMKINYKYLFTSYIKSQIKKIINLF